MSRAFVLIVVAACMPDPATTTLGPRDVGSERARVVGIFETPSGGHGEGLTLAEGQGREAIDDEATLVTIGRGEVCIELVIRNTDQGDYAKVLDDYEMTLLVDGAKTPLTLTTGEVKVLPGFTERRGRVCGTAPTARRVELRLVHPMLVHRSSVSSRVSKYELAFRWKLNG